MKKRICYIDLLRIIAIFGVIMIHVSSENWYNTNINLNWALNNLVNSLVQWGAALFIVISGYVQLDNEKFTIKTMVTKYIPKILLILILWHFIYYFWQCREFSGERMLDSIKRFFIGKSWAHLWYLYLLLGLYIFTPILRKLVKILDKSEFTYLLVLGFIFTSLVPTIENCFGINIMKYILPYKVFTVSIYIFYYLLGNYLKKYDIKKPYFILIISIVGLITFSILSYYKARVISAPFSYAGLANIFSVLFIISIFQICKDKFKEKENNLITLMGKLTFGVYLIHFIIEKTIVYKGLNPSMINPLVGNIIVSITVFIISYILSYIMSKLPIIKKTIGC